MSPFAPEQLGISIFIANPRPECAGGGVTGNVGAERNYVVVSDIAVFQIVYVCFCSPAAARILVQQTQCRPRVARHMVDRQIEGAKIVLCLPVNGHGWSNRTAIVESCLVRVMSLKGYERCVRQILTVQV